MSATPQTAPAEPRGLEDVIVPIRRVSPHDGGHWLFGYYEKCPWNASGRHLLGCRLPFADRQPHPGEKMTVGMFDLDDGDRFIELDRTPHWSWQQGTMLQWLGTDRENTVVYNSEIKGEPRGLIRDTRSGKVTPLPMCIYAVSPGGKRAVTLDFGRLHRLRAGYGYAGFQEFTPGQATPADNGIFGFDLPGGSPRLLISLAQLADISPPPTMAGVDHWANHLQWSTTGEHFAFLHRWRVGKDHHTRLCVARADGSDLRILCDRTYYSHYDWRDDRTILGFTLNEDGRREFRLHDRERGDVGAVGRGVLPDDGHCSYSPNRRWVLNDTYPQGPKRMRTLMLFDPATETRIDLVKIHSPPGYEGAIRCDLHPRWNRDGTQICIDSFHEGYRGIYVLDVSQIVKKNGENSSSAP